jgi:hypothetical protein
VREVVLHSEHLVVEQSPVVLVDGRLRVLELLEDNGRRAQELAELVAVEPTLLQLADLLEQSLI